MATSITRATVGNYYTDPTFESNWDGARAAGIAVGAYHVLRPDNSVDSQVYRLRQVLDGNDPKFIAIDCEVTAGADIERAVYWMGRRTREAFPNAEVAFYSAKWWWDVQVKNQDWVLQDGYGYWFAAYGSNNGQQPWATPPTSVIPAQWINLWKMWQYTSRGQVPGIVGNVDLDLMDEEYFSKVWGAITPPPEPEPDMVTITIKKSTADDLKQVLL